MEKIILGIDEVGRGPYAGPLVIGACILPKNREESPWIDELNDSKKLSEKKREELYEIIKKEAPASATGWVSSKELDEIGMSAALKLATRRAVEQIREKKVPFTEIIIDGISNFLVGTTLENHVTTMKKADFLIKEVSAASIVAKVERDNYMKNLAKKYPGYGFEKHVGYGTAFHQKAMENLGLTPEHRRSFAPVKKLAKMPENLENNRESVVKNTTTKIGQLGEQKIVDLLERNGHKILVRNYKTKFYEIDIVSRKNAKIFFTEVKARKDSTHGTPAEMVGKKKLEKMQLGAECFMKDKKLTEKFTLAVGTVEGEKLDWFVLED
ncbi:ribonuclease HII [Candidatus Saccharibacteria bacterium]|nr:ribonuclease HII [Candidatus Saccharibacteria bacterium]